MDEERIKGERKEAGLGRGRRGNKRSPRRSSGGVRQAHRGIDVPAIQLLSNAIMPPIHQSRSWA